MLELEALKNQIEMNRLTTDVLIFKCTGNSDFIFHQYLNQYRKVNNLQLEYFSEEDELKPNTDLFAVNSCVLTVYEVDTLSELPKGITPLWVRCKKVSAKVKKAYEDNIVELPKIEDWQIKDYISTALPKLEADDQTYIFKLYKANLYQLEKDMSKLTVFSDKNRGAIYNQVQDQLFLNSSQYVIFDLVNAIIRKDRATLSQVYKECSKIVVDAFGFTALLIDNFAKVIAVQLDKGASAERLGMESKQFWAIKNYSCNFYTREALLDLYDFLLSIDKKIKTGKLDTEFVVDYIISKVITM